MLYAFRHSKSYVDLAFYAVNGVCTDSAGSRV